MNNRTRVPLLKRAPLILSKKRERITTPNGALGDAYGGEINREDPGGTRKFGSRTGESKGVTDSASEKKIPKSRQTDSKKEDEPEEPEKPVQVSRKEKQMRTHAFIPTPPAEQEEPTEGEQSPKAEPAEE